jgi:hypothetical protein
VSRFAEWFFYRAGWVTVEVLTLLALAVVWLVT